MVTKTRSPTRRCHRRSTDEISPSLEHTTSHHQTSFCPESNDGSSNRALETPKRKPRSVVWSDLEQAPKLPPTSQQVTQQQQQQQTITSNKQVTVKKRRGISPNTHGRAIAGSLVSSPFDPSFLSSPNKLFDTFISPSQRSAAEETLFHVTSRRGRSFSSRGQTHSSSVFIGGDHVMKGAVASPTSSPSKKKRAPHSPLRRRRDEVDARSPDLSDFKIQQRRTKTGSNRSSSTTNIKKQSKTENYSRRRNKPLVLYCKANRERVKLENPDIKGAKAINKILYAEFAKLTPQEIAQWNEQAPSHDLTRNNKSAITAGADTKASSKVNIEHTRRKSCPPQFYHDMVFDTNCSPSNRESPSKFDSPSSFGLMESFEMEGCESSSKGANGRSGVSKQRQTASVSKGVNGESFVVKDETALGDEPTASKSHEATRAEDRPTESVHHSKVGKVEGDEKKKSTKSGEMKKRRRGRTQRSSLLTGLVPPDAITSQAQKAPESPIRAQQSLVTTMDEASDQVIPAEPREPIKKANIKSETLSNKELEEILLKRRRKSAERAKKAAAKKEAAKIAKSNAESTRLDDDSKAQDNAGFGDATVTVTMLPSAKKAQVEDNLILRLLNEDTEIFDKSASGEKVAAALLEEAAPQDREVVNPQVGDDPSAVSEGVANQNASKSSSSKTSPDSPRRKKRRNTSSLEKSSGIPSSVSDESSQIGKKLKAENNESISNKELEHHLQKRKKQNAERAKKAASKREKSTSIPMSSQQLGEAEATELALEPQESEQPLSEQRALCDSLSANHDACIASPESPLRAKRLLCALYDDNPSPNEEGKAPVSPLSPNLSNAIESETRHSDQSCTEEQDEDLPIEDAPTPTDSEVSGAEMSRSERLAEEPNDQLPTNVQDGGKCVESSHNDRNMIDVGQDVTLPCNDCAATEGVNVSLQLTPQTALNVGDSETFLSENANTKESGETAQSDSELNASMPPVVAENDTFRPVTTQQVEPTDPAATTPTNPHSSLSQNALPPNGAVPWIQSDLSNTNFQFKVPTDSFLHVPFASSNHEEKRLQILLAERQYQEKLAEYGRLELETKMMAERMLAIEERVRGIDSLSMFRRIDEFNPPEHFQSVVSRTYHSEILSSRKRRRLRSPRYFDASVDEYASSRHFSRRQSHSLVREERQSDRARHTSLKKTKKKESNREYIHDFSESLDEEEFEHSRLSSHEGLTKKKYRRRRIEDFSDDSSVEFDHPQRGTSKRSKEKENVRSRHSFDSKDRSRVEFEHSPRDRDNNSERKKTPVSRKLLNRLESPRRATLDQLSETRDRPRVEYELARHGNSSRKKKSSLSRKHLGRQESPRRTISDQLSESRDRALVASDQARHNKSSGKRKSPVPRKLLSSVESPRRAKSGQLSVLEDIGIQHASPRGDFENDKFTAQASSNQQVSPRAKTSAAMKHSKTTSVMGEVEEDIGTSTKELSNATSTKSGCQQDDTGNVIGATEPLPKSCWLTGEDTSDSDWDFEGPMILPPPPL